VDITPTTRRLVATYDARTSTRGLLGVLAGVVGVVGVALVVAEASADHYGFDQSGNRRDGSPGSSLFVGMGMFAAAGLLGVIAFAIPPAAQLRAE
jgi:hypothetical protein